MELLHNGYTLELSPGAFPLSTDSMVLADFVRLPKNAHVLDLGSGCGTLGMLLCAKDESCHVTGVEIDPNAHDTALKNAAANNISHRLSSICADVCTIPSLLPASRFSCCVSNPPYFSGGPQSTANPSARRENLCCLEDLFRSAAWAVKYGGDFFLVHRPERLAQICAVADKYGFTPKRLRMVRHQEGSPVSLILLACRKGAKPGLIWEELRLFDESGKPTKEYTSIYHL